MKKVVIYRRPQRENDHDDDDDAHVDLSHPSSSLAIAVQCKVREDEFFDADNDNNRSKNMEDDMRLYWSMVWFGVFLGSSSSSPSPSTIEFAPSKNPKTMWNVREHPLYSFKNAICFFYSLQKNTDFDLNCFSEGEEADSQNPIHAHIMSGLESSAIFTERTTDIVHSSQKRIVFSSR